MVYICDQMVINVLDHTSVIMFVDVLLVVFVTVDGSFTTDLGLQQTCHGCIKM